LSRLLIAGGAAVHPAGSAGQGFGKRGAQRL